MAVLSPGQRGNVSKLLAPTMEALIFCAISRFQYDVEDAGGHGRAFYQSPLIRQLSPHLSFPRSQPAPAEADAVCAQPLCPNARRDRPERGLVAPGPVPIATAARSAPAATGAADPGPPPWATRTRSATGNLFNRGVIVPRCGKGCRPGPRERARSPNCAERRKRKN